MELNQECRLLEVKRGLVTQNENGPIDYDFNLWIKSADDFNVVNDHGF